ncbi:hypothetical protein A6P39_008025 [Streptomyces sp. FXJ1.172]|uniref:hypothetical protein n=1 Tax=Streptomyces sp. FXJ1.172 TaxID=710705 RepID=UPI0007CFCB0B|nr:hypothetical protein [Streptomyces sp. FXJ1.172]WEO93967.1 hypothetical protein A6P39_008025 [Streptomyces sp. FXJ1.172]
MGPFDVDRQLRRRRGTGQRAEVDGSVHLQREGVPHRAQRPSGTLVHRRGSLQLPGGGGQFALAGHVGAGPVGRWPPGEAAAAVAVHPAMVSHGVSSA